MFRNAILMVAVVGLVACDDGGGGGGGADAGGSADAGVNPDGGAADDMGMADPVGFSDMNARACEMRFLAEPTAAVRVEFDDTVIGSWRRREDRVTVALTARGDVPFIAGSVAVSGVAEGQPELLRCYDAAGALIEGVQLIR